LDSRYKDPEARLGLPAVLFGRSGSGDPLQGDGLVVDGIRPSPAQRDKAVSSARAAVDVAWYRITHPDISAAGVDPAEHYLALGWQEGRWPNTAFDPVFYKAQFPTILIGDPLLHYLEHGEPKGIRPIAWFDPAWYRIAHGVADGLSALAHYVRHRLGGYVSPNPDFDARFYVAEYPDVLAAGMDPFEHYLTSGRAEGRLPRDERDILRASGLIDTNYYYINGPDVHQAGLDPVDHYASDGWREYRRPNPYFDGVWYAQRYAPTAMVSPLCHYVVEGEARGHRPSLYFDPGWYRTAYDLGPGQSPLRHYLAHRAERRFSPLPLFDIEFYVETYATELGRARDVFAHYLAIGAPRDLDPAPWFRAADYRQRHMVGKPPPPAATGEVARNPLLHFLCAFVLAADH
jgi:hypothetical protein